jgi:hypothetical protein
MKPISLLAVFCIGAATLPKPLSAAFTYVRLSVNGDLDASSVGFPNAKQGINKHTGYEIESGTEPNIDFFAAGGTATSPHGTAEATIEASASLTFSAISWENPALENWGPASLSG